VDASAERFVASRGGAVAEPEEDPAFALGIGLKFGLANGIPPGLTVAIGADGAVFRVSQNEVDRRIGRRSFDRGVEVERPPMEFASGEPLVPAPLGKNDAVEDSSVFFLHGDDSSAGLLRSREGDGGLEGFFGEVKGEHAARGEAFFIDDEGTVFDAGGPFEGERDSADEIDGVFFKVPVSHRIEPYFWRGGSFFFFKGEGAISFQPDPDRSEESCDGGAVGFQLSGDGGEALGGGPVLVIKGGEEVLCSGEFGGGGRARHGSLEKIMNASLVVGFGRQTGSHRRGPFFRLIDEEGIVQEHEGLGGDIGDIASSHGGRGNREIKSREERLEVVAFHPEVDRATRRPSNDGWSEGGAVELTGGGEEAVADGLGFESPERVGGEKRIGRVKFEGFGRGAARLLPGFGENEVADERFQRPALFVAEAVGEKVEQLGMARGLSEAPEIVHRRDDALAEEVMPESIHDDAAGEGILPINQIAGEL